MWMRLVFTILVVAFGFAVYELLARYRRHRLNIGGWDRNFGQTMLLYFRSQQCSACVAQARYLEQMIPSHQVRVKTIDVTREPEFAKRYGVMTLPTTIIIDRNGTIQYINYGLANAAKLSYQLTGSQSHANRSDSAVSTSSSFLPGVDESREASSSSISAKQV